MLLPLTEFVFFCWSDPLWNETAHMLEAKQNLRGNGWYIVFCCARKDGCQIVTEVLQDFGIAPLVLFIFRFYSARGHRGFVIRNTTSSICTILFTINRFLYADILSFHKVFIVSWSTHRCKVFPMLSPPGIPSFFFSFLFFKKNFCSN